MYRYSPFMVTSTTVGESRLIYGDLYTVGGYGGDSFFPHGWPHNLWIGPPPVV
jgi:hypothetical protein